MFFRLLLVCSVGFLQSAENKKKPIVSTSINSFLSRVTQISPTQLKVDPLSNSSLSYVEFKSLAGIEALLGFKTGKQTPVGTEVFVTLYHSDGGQHPSQDFDIKKLSETLDKGWKIEKVVSDIHDSEKPVSPVLKVVKGFEQGPLYYSSHV